MNIIEKKIELGDGRTISIETGKLAKQADGSALVRMGNTMLLATVVSAKEAREDVDFMPLSVEYREKYAAAGRYPGGFLKREARPSDYEILISRLIDRALRPLFPDDYHAETFVNVTLISSDTNIFPDALAGLAAAAALAVSDIPFNGPISEARVARINGEFIINPNIDEFADADIDIIVGATYDNILMIEGEMSEASEKEMLEAIMFAHESIKIHCKVLMELTEETGKAIKREYNHEQNDEDLKKKVEEFSYEKLFTAAKSIIIDKHKRHETFSAIKQEFIDTFEEEEEIDEKLIGKYFHDVEKKAVRNLVLEEKLRIDGRKTDEIRPIWCEIDYLPAAHGSAVFTRGETQSLTSVTLGTKLDEKIIDEVVFQGTSKFLLHYNFLPFSTGDARPYRGLSRREVGHGNLAHRALNGMIPKDPEINPYTIRIVSDILESNGSSSMATVCAGTLALLDSGIKMKKPVSGIAMGLITDNDGKYAILSDILGDEDHLGDMDFKVTGTKDGITACQMDIKVDGLPYEILEEALDQAKSGRLHILEKMTEVIAEPREKYKPHTPQIVSLTIPKDMIGSVIGPGGKIIQEIQAKTNSVISITEDGKFGIVQISATGEEAIKSATEWIEGIVAVPEVGKTYKGKVKTIVAFGAFIEILPGTDGLLHISEIEWRRLNTVEEVLKVGQEIEVKLLEVDRNGKLKLSRKALLPKPEGDRRGQNDGEKRNPDRNRRFRRND
jgi:polyribonucleotide nucleotidyltransferase